MKEKLKVKHYFDQILRQNFWFMVGWKWDLASKYLNDQFGYVESPGPEAHAKCIELQKENMTVIVIWVGPHKIRANQLGAIAHECIHATRLTFEARQINLDLVVDDEAFAYYSENLMRIACGGKI